MENNNNVNDVNEKNIDVNENKENKTRNFKSVEPNSIKANRILVIIAVVVLFLILATAFSIHTFFGDDDNKNRDDFKPTKQVKENIESSVKNDNNFVFSKKNLDVDKNVPSDFNKYKAKTLTVNSDENKNIFASQNLPIDEEIIKGMSSSIIGEKKISNDSSTTNNVGTTTNSDNSGFDVYLGKDGHYYHKDGRLADGSDGKIDSSSLVSNGGGGSEYSASPYTPTVAQKRKFDSNLLLPKGTYIQCSLNTRLISTISGGISCTVSDDVYSANGNVLLIEKGSKITGAFRNGQMNDGMERIFVVWQEITTPNDVVIPVLSGATDELGSSGMSGYVDHHWLQRFGASIMLSVIDDAFNVLINGKRGEQNVDYTENTRENTADLAKLALQKFINIEPTLYKNQGDLVGVYVNRDIDFSKVYRLEKIK